LLASLDEVDGRNVGKWRQRSDAEHKVEPFAAKHPGKGEARVRRQIERGMLEEPARPRSGESMEPDSRQRLSLHVASKDVHLVCS
jgi:hypothetical protein